MSALLDRIYLLATEIGRLQRRVGADPESSLQHLTDRLAHHVEALDGMGSPTAAAIYAANRAYGADEQESAEAALEDVDKRARELRRLLGRQAVDEQADQLARVQRDERARTSGLRAAA